MRCACASHLCEHGVHLEVRNTARDGEERPRSRQAPRRLHDTQHFLWIRRHVDYDERRVASCTIRALSSSAGWLRAAFMPVKSSTP